MSAEVGWCAALSGNSNATRQLREEMGAKGHTCCIDVAKFPRFVVGWELPREGKAIIVVYLGKHLGEATTSAKLKPVLLAASQRLQLLL